MFLKTIQGLWYTLPAFLSIIKLERLQITVLKKLHNLSKTVIFKKQNFHCYCPNAFSTLLLKDLTISNLWYMLPVFLANIKLEQLQITVLKQSRDFSKTIEISKVNFYCYHPNLFSKLFWIVPCFYALWYTLPAFLSNIKPVWL